MLMMMAKGINYFITNISILLVNGDEIEIIIINIFCAPVDGILLQSAVSSSPSIGTYSMNCDSIKIIFTISSH